MMNHRQSTKWKAKDEKDYRLLNRSILAMKLQGEPRRSVQIMKWCKMLRRAIKIKLNRGSNNDSCVYQEMKGKEDDK